MAAIVSAPPPLFPERLRAIASEAWPLLPVPPDERKHLLRDEAAFLVDRLLVQVARASGAIAEAVLSVAIGEAEAFWVAMARRDTVRALGAAAHGGQVEDAEKEDVPFERIALDVDGEGREVVEEALGLAGKLLGAASPRWQRVEALCQEYLSAHPEDEPAEEDGPARHVGTRKMAPATDVRAWLEREYGRWSYLYSAEPVPAPEAAVDDLDRARRIDARLRELAAM